MMTFLVRGLEAYAMFMNRQADNFASLVVQAWVKLGEPGKGLVNSVTRWDAARIERSEKDWAHREAMARVRWAKVTYELRDEQ